VLIFPLFTCEDAKRFDMFCAFGCRVCVFKLQRGSCAFLVQKSGFRDACHDIHILRRA